MDGQEGEYERHRAAHLFGQITVVNHDARPDYRYLVPSASRHRVEKTQQVTGPTANLPTPKAAVTYVAIEQTRNAERPQHGPLNPHGTSFSGVGRER